VFQHAAAPPLALRPAAAHVRSTCARVCAYRAVRVGVRVSASLCVHARGCTIATPSATIVSATTAIRLDGSAASNITSGVQPSACSSWRLSITA
jgi:hypothetical protein